MQSKVPLLPLLFALTSGADPAGTEGGLVPQCGGPFQLCGYIEKESGAERIPQRFEVAGKFSEGLAAVRMDGAYGFIDPTGRTAIAARFEAAGPFHGGYAEVRLKGASGIIDRSGRMVVPAKFRRIVPFANGTFIALPGREGSAPDSSPEPRLEKLSDMLSGLGGGLYHVGRGWLTPADLQFSIFDEPARGLIWAGRRNEHYEDQWGLLRSDGTWQVTPRYNHVQRLVETHAVVGSMPDYSLPWQERRKAMRRGAVNRDGKLVVPMEFGNVSYWRGGYGLAHEAGTARKGILLGNGALLANRYFDDVEVREDGKLPRGLVGKTWYSIEPDGRLVPDQLDGAPLVECAGGLTIVQRGEVVEFRRPGDGKPVGQFDDTYFSARDCPGPFSARRRGKWFFVLEDGAVLGGQKGFDSTYSFSGDHGAVQVVGKWGIIDRSGAFTVKPSFAKLRPAGRNLFAVGGGKNLSWINANGQSVEKPIVERPPPEQALTCKGGLRFFTKAGLWGLQDNAGRTVIEPRFRALSCFNQGVSWTAAPGDGDWCAVGPDGRPRELIKCRKTFYPIRVTHHYPESFSSDPFESSVLWNRAWLEHLAGQREKPPMWISDGQHPGSYSVMPGQ